MDRLTPRQRSRCMRRIKSKGSSIEKRLQKALWSLGLRYKKNDKSLPGSPDLALHRYRIAIFCDSEFFHGKDWEELQERLARGSRAAYWTAKICRNRQRDGEVERQLGFLGWRVLRFWGRQIERDLEGCVRCVQEAVWEAGLGDED